jgi:hypothetical protein
MVMVNGKGMDWAGEVPNRKVEGCLVERIKKL